MSNPIYADFTNIELLCAFKRQVLGLENAGTIQDARDLEAGLDLQMAEILLRMAEGHRKDSKS